MGDIVGKVFGGEYSPGVERCMQDEELKRQILEDASEFISTNNDILWRYPREQIISLTIAADFAKPMEALYIANVINYYMFSTGSLVPTVTDDVESIAYGTQDSCFSSRCLVYLGFFYDKAVNRSNRTGAPGPKYLSKQAIFGFRNDGLDDVADNFHNWIEFLNDNFRASTAYP